MTEKYSKKFRTRKDRFKLGFKRTVQFWNPFMKNKYRKRVKYNTRVTNATPLVLNILLGVIIVLFFIINSVDSNGLRNNPLALISMILILIFLFIMDCWYAGVDD